MPVATSTRTRKVTARKNERRSVGLTPSLTGGADRKSDYLSANGTLYLTPGNWSGQVIESIFVQPGNVVGTLPVPSLVPVTCALGN
jgi:hypothetical protein